MASSRPFRLSAAFHLLILIGQALAYPPLYCSDENTASSAQNSSIFQSSGLCHDFCVNNWALAVLQEHGCWCTNYTPADTTSVDDCTYSCPGYPDDNCGGPGLYAYIELNKVPLGVKGAGGGAAGLTTSATQQVTVTAPAPSPVTVTDTLSPVPVPVPEPSSTSEFSTSIAEVGVTSSTTSETSSSATWTPTPVTSLETITGQVRTVTVTPTSPPTSQTLGASKSDTSSSGSRSLGTGGAVGLTVGLVGLVAVICAIIFCCLRKRKKGGAEQYNNMNASRRGSGAGGLGGSVPQRTMSENSKYVLNTDGQRVVETWEDGNVPGSRRSRLMPVDPRLNPFAPVYQRGENKSRESINTIRDDHDYSRRVHQMGPILRATNPDES